MKLTSFQSAFRLALHGFAVRGAAQQDRPIRTMRFKKVPHLNTNEPRAAVRPPESHLYTLAVESLLISFFTIASTLSSNSKLEVRGL